MEEQDAILEERINEIREEGKESEDPAVTENTIKEATDKINTYKQQLQADNENRVRELKQLQRRKKVSLDDERDPTQFKLDAYNKDFVDNSETSNNVQSVLSAMITQIESEKQW